MSSQAIEDARQFVQAALGENCDDSRELYGDDPLFSDNAFALQWKGKWSDTVSTATLYSIFCIQGAYNTVRSYAIKDQYGTLELISFAEPQLKIEYIDEDTQTKLKAPPSVSGFVTRFQLVNPEFNADTQTLVSQARWRGLGDAWSSGRWAFEEGKFVLKQFDVDPTYDANLENPSDEDIEKYYTVYKAD
jgi:hypothetical protein